MEKDAVIYENERLDEVNDKLRLIQRTDGLTFGTDALLLASYIKEMPKGRAMELGAGSGIISLLCATRERFSHIDCVEIQKVFSDLTERNIALNGLSDRISVINSDVREIADRLEKHTYDAVFTNPPYMKEDSGKKNESEYKHIARHERYGTIYDFVKCAADMLKFGGYFYCVYRPDRMSELFSAMQKNLIEPKKVTFVHATSKSEPSMMLVMAKSGAKPSMKVTAPLIIYKDGTKEFTEMTERIYECGSYEEK